MASNLETRKHAGELLEVEAVIEIPRGSRNKYEMDHASDEIWLDRRLFTAMGYPTDYGFIADTLGEDGDPLDVLVLLDEPTFPGCHIMVRPVGVFWMTDEKGPDAKILSVPSSDPRFLNIRDLEDLPGHLTDEIAHFFEVYKALEPGKSTEVSEWEGAEAARTEIVEATRRAQVSH
jgi:inorganic pyrophosphatase